MTWIGNQPGLGHLQPPATEPVAGPAFPMPIALPKNVVVASPREVSADSAIDITDSLILADATAGPITLDLPAVADFTHPLLFIRAINTDANEVTLQCNGAETIDGANSVPLGTIATGVTYLAVTLAAAPLMDTPGWWVV